MHFRYLLHIENYMRTRVCHVTISEFYSYNMELYIYNSNGDNNMWPPDIKQRDLCFHEPFTAPRDIFHWTCHGHVSSRQILIYNYGMTFIHGCEMELYGYSKSIHYGMYSDLILLVL